MEPNYIHELLDELARQGVEPNYIHELLDELARQGVEPNYIHELLDDTLVPRPLPDFISQPWKNIGRRPGIIATSWAGNGGLD